MKLLLQLICDKLKLVILSNEFKIKDPKHVFVGDIRPAFCQLKGWHLCHLHVVLQQYSAILEYLRMSRSMKSMGKRATIEGGSNTPFSKQLMNLIKWCLPWSQIWSFGILTFKSLRVVANANLELFNGKAQASFYLWEVHSRIYEVPSISKLRQHCSGFRSGIAADVMFTYALIHRVFMTTMFEGCHIDISKCYAAIGGLTIWRNPDLKVPTGRWSLLLPSHVYRFPLCQRSGR